MYPLNFQPVSGESLNMPSIDGLLQSAQGKSNTVPVETSFSSYMERAQAAESTDGNTQTQVNSLDSEQVPPEVVVVTEVSETDDIFTGENVTVEQDVSFMAFENQMARITDMPELEPFDMEVSFEDDGTMYTGVQIQFTAQEENDFDAEIDRFLGFSDEDAEPVAAENLVAAITMPAPEAVHQNPVILNEKTVETDEVNAIDAGKKTVKGKKSGTVMESISVVDERTVEVPDAQGSGKTVTMTAFDGKNSAEMSLNLGQQAEQQYFQDNQTGAYTGSIEAGLTKTDFTSMISEEIKNNAGEFVKTGSIVLKNDNKGSINLILHPEQLGNVKIRLELSDNQITGKIVVASKEAYDAFKQSMNELKQAFVASGFDTNGFDLTWTGSQGSSQQGNPENQDRIYENLNAALAQRSSDSYLDNMPDDSIEGAGSSTTYINLVA